MEPINGCLDYAYKLKLISYKPTDIAKIPPSPKKINVWNETQLKYFLTQIKDTPLYIPVITIALTGLRVGELCGLRWENIDLETGFITVKEQVIIDKLNHTLIHDNILSYRSISIPQTLCNILSKHKASQQFNHKGFIITDKNNNMYNPRNLSMNFSRQVSKYKYTLEEMNKLKKEFNNYMQLPQFSIHGLRHTHATILLLKNENIKVISQRLGHKSTKVTWDTYSHVLPSMQMKTALLLDDMISTI